MNLPPGGPAVPGGAGPAGTPPSAPGLPSPAASPGLPAAAPPVVKAPTLKDYLPFMKPKTFGPDAKRRPRGGGGGGTAEQPAGKINVLHYSCYKCSSYVKLYIILT